MTDFEGGILKPGIEQYAEEHTSPELPVLAKLARATHLRTHMPQMLSGHTQGAFLQMVSRLVKPMSVLEVGTFTGYSAICLAGGLQPGGKLTTIELNAEMVDFARPFVEEAGLTRVVEMLTGDALEIIPALEGPFDLVFIDADKENYMAYFDMTWPKVTPGGLVLIDNTLWYGRVIDPASDGDCETESIRLFNRYVSRRTDAETVLLPVRDGITMVRKR